ncbi:MAG: hypothetical protein JRI55_36720 [Deltaproteobacteria bacterium]|nr:hypothetical protein [Deltaproteobacteria bacterium]
MRTVALGMTALAAAWLSSTPAEACTTFYVDHEGPTMGKSYDWYTTPGAVYVNKRGWKRTSMSVNALGDVYSEWTSKYASITFNDYGYRLPDGGVNEAGLAVDIMLLNDTTYPAADGRPSYNEVEWVQYALDNFASVVELAAAADTYRISPLIAGFHYLACDTTGDCAAFEYLNGQLVITPAASMPVKTLTNDTYAASAAYLAQHEGFGGTDPIPTGYGSLDRFVRASWLMTQPPALPVPDSTFAIVDDVASGYGSPWRIVYRLAEGRAYWRTYNSPTVKHVDLSSFDLNCYSGDVMLDVDDPGAGDVSASFVPFDAVLNEQRLDASVEPFADEFTEAERTFLVSYMATAHEQQECTIEPPTGDGDDDDDSSDEGGCSVRQAGDSAPAWALLGLLGLGVGVARRSRRLR